MRIKQYKYKIDKFRSIKLNKNTSFPLLDLKSECYFVNYKTMRINDLYIKLLPFKINDLRILKNQLLKDVSNYNKNIDNIIKTDFYKNDLFKKSFPKEYKSLMMLFSDTVRIVLNKHIDNLEERQFKRLMFKKFKKSYSLLDTEHLKFMYNNRQLLNDTDTDTDTDKLFKFLDTEFKEVKTVYTIEVLTDTEQIQQQQKQFIKDTDIYKRFIQSLKYTIKQIDKSIKHYETDLYNKEMLQDYKVNMFDLSELEKGKVTNNIKTILYFYIIKLKKTKISKKAYDYLNGFYYDTDTDKTIIIKDILNDYSNYDNIKHDFKELIKNDLINFENRFLYKTV
jgi:hypothetical protein